MAFTWAVCGGRLIDSGAGSGSSRLTAAERLVCALITARRSGGAGRLLVGEILGCQYSGDLLVRIRDLFRCNSGRRTHLVATAGGGCCAAGRQRVLRQSGAVRGTKRGRAWVVCAAV